MILTIFRIFHEIHNQVWETSAPADAAYMVDQSHNLKRKMEAIIHTVCTAQELYAKAAIVDHGAHGATAAELLAGRG
jgi:L-rhamnose isomerase / sugar isomerase